MKALVRLAHWGEKRETHTVRAHAASPIANVQEGWQGGSGAWESCAKRWVFFFSLLFGLPLFRLGCQDGARGSSGNWSTDLETMQGPQSYQDADFGSSIFTFLVDGGNHLAVDLEKDLPQQQVLNKVVMNTEIKQRRRSNSQVVLVKMIFLSVLVDASRPSLIFQLGRINVSHLILPHIL